MQRRVVAVMAVAMVLPLVAGWALRQQLGFELSTHSIQSMIASMGWKAPALFLGLMTFRQFIFLPAIVILPVGGLVFGTTLGTVLGATGIVLSALITFAIARRVGGEWLRDLFGHRTRIVEHHIEHAGPAVVGLVTAHPTGPMAAFFWAAGFSSMALLPFAAAVAMGGSLRALAYSFLGSTLLVPGSPQFYVAATVLALAAVAPFAHPRLRRRILAPRPPSLDDAV